MRGLPVRTAMRTGLFDRPVVRALLAYLRVVADPTASLELYLLAQADPHCLEPAVLARLLHTARQQHRSLWEILSAAVDAHDDETLPGAALASSTALVAHVRSGIAASADRPSGRVLYGYVRDSGLLKKLAQLASEPAAQADAQGVAHLFALVQRRAALLEVDRVPFLVPHLDQRTEASDDPGAGDPFDEQVSVLTVHRAKGLEFKVVFMCGLVDGRFPVRARPPALALPSELAARPDGDDAHLQEERRLFYVALTRGRDEVHLSYHASHGEWPRAVPPVAIRRRGAGPAGGERRGSSRTGCAPALALTEMAMRRLPGQPRGPQSRHRCRSAFRRSTIT